MLLGSDGNSGEVGATGLLGDGSGWVMGSVLAGCNAEVTDNPKAPWGPTSPPPSVATIVTVCKQIPGRPTNGWPLVEVTVAVHWAFPTGGFEVVLTGAMASEVVLSFGGDPGAVGGIAVLFGGDTGTAGGLVLLSSGDTGAAGELTLTGVTFKLVDCGSGPEIVGLTSVEGGSGLEIVGLTSVEGGSVLGTGGGFETDTTTCSDVEGTGAGGASDDVAGGGAATECDVGATGTGVEGLPSATAVALSLLSASNITVEL